MQSLHERTREGTTVSEYVPERPRDHTEPDTLYLINSLVVTEAFMERSCCHSSGANTQSLPVFPETKTPSLPASETAGVFCLPSVGVCLLD